MTNSRPPITALAAVIHSLREAHGLSVNKLAATAGMTESTLRKRLRGDVPPFNLDELEAVASQFGTTGYRLLTLATEQQDDAA